MVDPRAELLNNHPVGKLDPFRSKINDSYDSWGPRNLGDRADKYRNNNWGHDDGVLFRPLNREDEDSGVHSPPLWTASPPRQYQINNNHRTQAIARGQRELMEIVKNMPESCYELSLKDLVEQPRVEVDTQEECLLGDDHHDQDQQEDVVAYETRVVNIKRLESKKNEKKSNTSMKRSGSMDNRGLFLKMVFPISLSSNKKQKHVNSCTTCAKVSPKPAEVSDRTSKLVDKDWWKKRSSCSIESDSSGRSSHNNNGSIGSSGSSSRNSSVRKKSGFFFRSCLPCFGFTNGKLAE